MPKYEVIDNVTGKKYQLEGDSPPTEQELGEIFASQREQPIVQPVAESKPKSMSFGERALDIGKGMIETPVALATGMVGAGAGFAGSVGAGLMGKSPEEAKKFREHVQGAYSYQPTSESGKGAMDILNTAMTPLTWPRKILEHYGGEQWGNVGDALTFAVAPKIPKAMRKIAEVPAKTGRILFRKTLQPEGTFNEARALTSTGYNPPTAQGTGAWSKIAPKSTGKNIIESVKNRFKTYDSSVAGRTNFMKDLDAVKREASQVLAKNQGKTVPLKNLTGAFDELIDGYASMDVRPDLNIRALQKMKETVTDVWTKKYPNGKIPVQEAQNFKVSLYNRTKDAWGETKTAMTTEGRKALGSKLRNEIETAIPELGVVNRNMAPLLEFQDALEKSISRIKNEKFSITNTIFNNDYLLGKLAKVFKAVSPKHPLSTPEAVKAYVYARQNADFKEAFEKQKDTSYVKGVPGQYIGYEGNWKGGFPKTEQKQLGFDPNTYKQRQIPYDWKAEANKPATAVLVDDFNKMFFRGKGMKPDVWSKDPSNYPIDIGNIVGQRKGKVQIPNDMLMKIMEAYQNGKLVDRR